MICGLAAAWWAMASLPAFAQRVQFATPLAQMPAPATGAPALPGPPPTSGVPGAAASPYPMPAPAVSPPLSSPPPTMAPAPPATFSAPGATLGAPTAPSAVPTYTPPPGYAVPPPAAPGAVVQPPPANWDPYAAPGGAPGALVPQDPCLPAGPPATFATVQKFLQHVDLDYHWFAGHNGTSNVASGSQELGINDVELSGTFAFPIFFNSQTPLLITPGFAVHYWEGPVSVPPTPADLPARTYDAYLDAAWNPQINAWFGAELEARIGTYSDFANVKDVLVLFTGKAEAVLTFSPCVKVKAGVWYLDRNLVKMLPAGGICWTPNPDVYFNILFPNPKIARRLTTWGTTDWWLYASGDYGGGRWGIKRESGLTPAVPTDGTFTSFDYNDIRFAVGLEFNTLRQLHGMFEAGVSFDRQIVYQDGIPGTFHPDATVYLRAGLAY
jgi:hypothetical protein